MIKYTKEQFLDDIYQALYGQPVLAPSTPTVDRLREMASGAGEKVAPVMETKPVEKPKSKRKRVERDGEGRIKAIVEEEG